MLYVVMEYFSGILNEFTERASIIKEADCDSLLELQAARRTRSPNQTHSTLYVLVILLCCLHQYSLVAANPIASHFNCTEKPTIQHANLLSDTNNSYLKYVCNQGFRMVNPVTVEHSAGILKCTDNGWTPQPLPICRPVEIAGSSGAILKSTNDEEPNNACKCPQENFKDVKVSKVIPASSKIYRGHNLQSSNDGYNIGDTLIFTCNISDGDRLLFNTKLENFFVYPSAYRTCQADCTWSGTPPVCLDPSKPMLYNKVPMTNATNCSSGDCLFERNKRWVQVNDIKLKSEKGYTRLYWVQFPRHVHLNFMTVKSVYGSGSTLGTSDVQLEVNPLAVVANLSRESRSLFDSRYDQLKLGQRTAIKVSAYTREIIVKLYVEATTGWSPELEFYTVPEAGMKGLNGGKCPNPPTIPNAQMYISKDGMNVEYRCNKEYQLKDPLLNELSSGKITCNNGFEWSPYPFPVCQVNNSSSFGSIEKEYGEEEDLPNRTDSHAMFSSRHDHPKNNNEPGYHTTIAFEVTRVQTFALGESAFIIAVILTLLASFGIVLIIFIAYKLLHHRRSQKTFTLLPQERNRHQNNHDYDYPFIKKRKGFFRKLFSSICPILNQRKKSEHTNSIP